MRILNFVLYCLVCLVSVYFIELRYSVTNHYPELFIVLIWISFAWWFTTSFLMMSASKAIKRETAAVMPSNVFITDLFCVVAIIFTIVRLEASSQFWLFQKYYFLFQGVILIASLFYAFISQIAIKGATSEVSEKSKENENRLSSIIKRFNMISGSMKGDKTKGGELLKSINNDLSFTIQKHGLILESENYESLLSFCEFFLASSGNEREISEEEIKNLQTIQGLLADVKAMSN
jgi:hypothetical protein